MNLTLFYITMYAKLPPLCLPFCTGYGKLLRPGIAFAMSAAPSFTRLENNLRLNGNHSPLPISFPPVAPSLLPYSGLCWPGNPQRIPSLAVCSLKSFLCQEVCYLLLLGLLGWLARTAKEPPRKAAAAEARQPWQPVQLTLVVQ